MPPPTLRILTLVPLFGIASLVGLVAELGVAFYLIAAELLALLGAAAETALDQHGRMDLLELSEARGRRARMQRVHEREGTHRIDAKLLRFLGNALLVIGLAHVVLSSPLPDAAGDRSLPLPTVLLVLGLAFLTTFLVNDVLVRLWVSRRPESVLLSLEPVLRVLCWLLMPLRLLVVGLARALFRTRIDEAGPSAREEVLETVEEGEREGSLSSHEADMIESIIELKQSAVRDVMTPRADIVMVGADTPIAEAVTVLHEEGYSRLPVYGEDKDDVIGLLYARDLIPFLSPTVNNPPAGETVRAVMRTPVFFVPGGKTVSDLLQEMRARKVHLAVVVDEFQGTDGLVTIEDLLEEIVGEIHDEYDEEAVELDASPEQIESGVLEIDGRTPIEEINEAMSVDLPVEDDFETMGGLVFHRMGAVPKAGEEVDLGPVHVRILEADDRTVKRLQVQVTGVAGPRP